MSQPEVDANEDQLTLITTLLPTKALSSEFHVFSHREQMLNQRWLVRRRGCLPLQYLREEFEAVEAQFLFLPQEMKEGYCLERQRYVEEVTSVRIIHTLVLLSMTISKTSSYPLVKHGV